MLDGPYPVRVGHGDEPIERVCDARAFQQLRMQIFHILQDDGGQKVVLVLEIPVKRRMCVFQRGCDLLERYRLIPLPHKHFPGNILYACFQRIALPFSPGS